MKGKRVFRQNRKSASQRAAERVVREKFQREKPSLADLVRSGDCQPADVMKMGQYCDLQLALQALRRERERAGLSITDVAARSGLDRAVVSRLETGKQDNPTAATLMRYAAAIGKRLLWAYENLPAEDRGRQPVRRRTKKRMKDRDVA